MNYNNDSEDSPSEATSPDTESSRKRKKTCWTLTGRQTDKDILQEMGVGILSQSSSGGDSPLDDDNQLKAKRKKGIENVNPNANSISPRAKISPKKSPGPKKSPKSGSIVKISPTPGPSRIKPWDDDARPIPRSSEITDIPTTEEETPLPQYLVRTQYKDMSPHFGSNLADCFCERTNSIYSGSPINAELNEEILLNLRSHNTEIDSFSVLSDEVMLTIFKWLPKITLADCMLVCKRWHRIASDETFWQRLELGNKDIATDALGKILARKPIIVRLAGSQIGKWSNPSGYSDPSRIQYLDLSMCTIDMDTLNGLLEKCPSLKKLSLEFVNVNDTTTRLLGRCNRLETLNLTLSKGITENGLLSILQGCQRLQSLNLSWCNLCSKSLQVLCDYLNPHLQRLNIAGAKALTNELLSSLVSRCPRLLELDISDCGRVNDVTCLTDVTTLEHLALSRCYLLPPPALTKLNRMPSLQYLEVWGMLQSTSITVLKKALPAIQINQFMHSAIARPTVGPRRTSIWGLRTRD